jgi:hypothetical protein
MSDASVRHGEHPAGDGRRGSATATAGRSFEMQRMAGGPKEWIDRVRTLTRFRTIGLTGE